MKPPKRTCLLVIFFSFFFCHGTFAQSYRTESILIIKQEKREEYFEPVETLLTGEEARLFNWKEHTKEPIKVVIKRKREVRIEEGNKANLSKSPSHEDFLSEIHQIYSINDAGDIGTYARTKHDWIDEGGLQGIHFRLIASQEEEDRFRALPNVHFQRYWNRREKEPELLWADSGECPDEFEESDLPEGEVRIFFQNKKGKTIFRRTIITTLIPLEEWREARIVEIEDERYIR